MTAPKLLPCPTCESTDSLAVIQYENGWRHVECAACWLMGPGEGSKVQAIKSYNDRVRAGTIWGVPGMGQKEADRSSLQKTEGTKS